MIESTECKIITFCLKRGTIKDRSVYEFVRAFIKTYYRTDWMA